MILNIKDYSDQKKVTFNRPTQKKVNLDLNLNPAPFIDNSPKKKKEAADPIKDINDINRIISYFISTGRYRDNLLFVMGISFGLRCGDLLKIKIGNIIDAGCNFKEEVTVCEEKTKKIRTCFMNDYVMDAAELYLSSLTGSIDLNDYLFKNQSNNNSAKYYETLGGMTNKDGKPINVKREVDHSISVRAVEDMLKDVINKKLHIDIHAGTHCMRKTFAYHVINSAPDRSRAIEFLQRILGHSSQSITLAYAGITDDEIKTTCNNLYKGKLNFCFTAGLSNVI